MVGVGGGSGRALQVLQSCHPGKRFQRDPTCKVLVYPFQNVFRECLFQVASQKLRPKPAISPHVICPVVHRTY